MENSMEISQKKLELTYDPGMPFPGIYQEETIIWKDTCTTVFIAVLFTIDQPQKQT